MFLALVAILLWQEAKRRGRKEHATYVVSDSLRYIEENLDPDIRRRLGNSGIQRIVEWEIFYLQGLAQEDRHRPVETVAGGSEPSVEYIHRQIANRHRVEIPSDDIRAVLELEARYLHSIGAVGEEVGPLAESDEEQKGKE